MTDVLQFQKTRGEEGELADQPRLRQDQVAPNHQINLRWVLGVLRRRKAILMFCIAFIPLITTFIVFNLTPGYLAQTRLLIEGVREPTGDINTVQKDIPFDLSDVQTEAAVIRSREFARLAADRLNLLEDPTFNPTLNPKVRKSTMRVWREKYFDQALDWIGGKVPLSPLENLVRAGPTKPDLPLTEEELAQDAIDKLMGGTKVIPASHARVITIQQTSADAAFAARAANTFAELYIDGGHAQKVKTTGRTSVLLTEKVDELRNLVLDSQKKLEEFRNSAHISEPGDVKLLRQQILQLNQTLLNAETQRAGVHARYERARAFLETPEDVDGAATVLNSQLINDMRLQETQLQSKLSELRSRYRSRHPKVIQTRKQIADLKFNISDEIKKVMAQLGTEVGISDRKVTKVRNLVANLEEQFRYEREAEATIHALAMEMNTNKQLYDVLLERLKESSVRDAPRQQVKARIISRAITPRTPVFPHKWIMISTSVLIALVLGILFSVGLECLIPGYRTLAELEKDTKIPVVSMVPAQTEPHHHTRPLFRSMSEIPHERPTESMRKLHSGLTNTTYDQPSRLIAVTSTLRGEGKTSIVLGLAAVSIQTGRRVLVIDCDMRLPKIHLQLGVNNVLGMSDLLSGRAMFDDVIDFDLQSGIHYITAGTSTKSSDYLLNSVIMDQLIDYAGRQFNLILFNIPPVLSGYGSLAMLPKLDRTVFCVKWERTPRELVRRAMRLTLETGARMHGTMLTHVDLKIQRMIYGQENTYYYYYGSRSVQS